MLVQEDADEFQRRCKNALNRFIGEPMSYALLEEITNVLYLETMRFMLEQADRGTRH